MNIRTRFVGIDVSSPIFVASAGITERLDLLKKAQDNGAGGAVMKSWFEEEISRQSPTPRFCVIRHPMGQHETFSLYSYEQASEWDAERYAEEVHQATETLEMLVIPSINCYTLEGWARYAQLMENAGARAIELNTSCPHGSITFSGHEVEQMIFDSVRAAREATTIPLIAKLSPMVTNPGHIAKELERIGVQAVTIFNRMTGLDIDLETEAAIMHKGYAGHGGPWAIQYALRWISQLSPQLKIDIAGTSGISTGEDVVKYLLCGATIVQVCSAVVMHGYPVIRRITDEFRAWVERKGYEGVDGFRGKACGTILSTSEIDRRKQFIALVEDKTAPPCQVACPIGTSVQGYIQLIAEGRFDEAYELAADRNPFPGICGRVCHRPCEPECTRSDIDDPLAIAELKRFVADYAARKAKSTSPALLAPPRKERVAVIGGGPAGLTAARELARLGYKITVFDAAPILGGMMVLGIPRFRLPRDVIQSEIDAILRLGIDVETQTKLGRDISIQGLRKRGFHAILIAVGAHKPIPLNVPGEHFSHVFSALDLLRRANLGEEVRLLGDVVVIGGGDAALDAARSAVRLGAATVVVLYRRSEAEMPASPQEREDASEEGVQIKYLCAPIEIRPGVIRCIKNRLGEKDESGRRRPEPIEGSEFELAADFVINAIGQEVDLGAKPELAELFDSLRKGELGSTGIFAAGDALTGPQTLIDAIASGHRAAAAIHAYLSLQTIPVLEIPEGRVNKADLVNEETILTRRQRRRMRPLLDRVRSFEEASCGFSEAQARAEAARCLGCAPCAACGQCARICIYDAITIDNGQPVILSDCDGCGLCVHLCPKAAIGMVTRQ